MSQGLETDHLPEELCLEFFTPFSFNPQGVLRTRLEAERFLAALERRLKRVLDLKLTLPRDELRVLPWYWDYVQFPHAAHSEPGVKYLHGCVGKLYVKGAGWDTLAALRLCADLQLGAATAFGLGYYRLHETSVPYFATGFPDAGALRAAVEQVMERYDDALPLLSAQTDMLFSAGDRRRARFGLPARERLIEKPALKDLVVQQYLNRRLAPVLDRMFEPESLGYRKGYSREHAALRTTQ
ncbi:MAG: CRISPR system precrRNA processing endoribonuclease RAMP protein Cas6 [Gammaproteobacteria bacterium]